MYVLLGCMIALIIVAWVHYRTEPFQNTPIPTIDSELVTNYKAFAKIYNEFLTTWQKAIVSSMSADQPQEAATSPSQSPSGTPPIPPNAQMNAYIANLSQLLGKSLPNMTDPLPTTIDINTFPVIAPRIPTNPAPYTNALQWMNKQLQEAHEQLQSALKGESFKDLEGFDNQTCQDLSKCFRDNPELAQQMTAVLQEQQQKTQQQVSAQMKQFMANPAFAQAFRTNQQLVEQSKQVQNQAQSGELLNQIDLPAEPGISYSLPAGSDKFLKMDYAKQQEVKAASPSMFSLKTLMDQINANLR
jgi:hypothetical protein